MDIDLSHCFSADELPHAPARRQKDSSLVLERQATGSPVPAAPTSKPSVTGSRGGNAALASLLTALNACGIITNSTTA